MTLRERFDKLEPRERRLLSILGTMLGVFLFLLGPIGIYSVVSGRRSDNQDLRDLIDKIYDSRAQVAERNNKRDALRARYARQAPALAGFIDEAFKENGASAAESQDRAPVPHGKRYSERATVVKIHKIGMLALSKTLEKIEQSGYPLSITRLSIKPRVGEPDNYEVELGVSAFDRSAEAKEPKDPAAAGSASAAPDKDKDKEKDQ
jgi:general secretion pathway protein M